MDIKSWLRTVLQHYQDPERTFRDVDSVLQTYLSLKPKMDTYTSNDGNTQLLLCLHGTVPITYRSVPYNIPVAFWVPKEYPKVPPIPYVKPTANMLIREGRHVDKSGLCYHHYRSTWSNDQKHTLLELVAILQQVFAQEPPVYTKPTTSNSNSHIGSPQPPKESLLDRVSSQRQSMPSQSMHVGNIGSSPEVSQWMGESTALYNMNQGLAALNLNSNSHINLSKSTSLPTIATTNNMPYPQLQQQQQQQQLSINSSVSITKDIKNQSLQEVLYRKVTERLQQYNVSISGDMDKLLIQNRQLNEGEVGIEQEFRALNDIKERLKYNNSVIDKKSKEIDQIIESVNSMPDVQVDEALYGTTVVGNQLFELVADDNAISDTVYFLAKALNSERIDLVTFMKYTRMLSREQFMKRALIKKITQT
ncbi:MAG: UEV domain-containing protein [Benjaminiella poitrasii]|nr:MAG: UEV domain-containing protein [Benjaminiella poitrasii]